MRLAPTTDTLARPEPLYTVSSVTESSNQIGTSTETDFPAAFSHPRGYINENGDYAIWVGTPPGVDPEFLASLPQPDVTYSGTADPTPEQWAEALSSDDVFEEITLPHADPKFEAAPVVASAQRSTERARRRL